MFLLNTFLVWKLIRCVFIKTFFVKHCSQTITIVCFLIIKTQTFDCFTKFIFIKYLFSLKTKICIYQKNISPNVACKHLQSFAIARDLYLHQTNLWIFKHLLAFPNVYALNIYPPSAFRPFWISNASKTFRRVPFKAECNNYYSKIWDFP